MKFTTKVPTAEELQKAIDDGVSNSLMGKLAQGGMKYDAGKPITGALYQDFPRALQAVAEIATYGANKYARSSWRTVPNAIERYTDALHRHLLDSNLVDLDGESGLPHLAHAAWNVLAVLEMTLGEWAVENAAALLSGDAEAIPRAAADDMHDTQIEELGVRSNLALSLRNAAAKAELLGDRNLAATLAALADRTAPGRD